MSEDKSIHNLIEQQDDKAKQESWATIQSRLESADVESNGVKNGVNTRAAIFSKRAVLWAICAAVLLTAVILLIVLLPRKDGGPDVPDGFEDFNGMLGAGSAGEYSTVSTDYTLKDYAAQTGNDFLYFDWYDKTTYEDHIVKSNVTDKIICYKETIYDAEGGYSITLNITEPTAQIGSLSKYDSCPNTRQINGTEVKWNSDSSSYFSAFVHKDFRYCIEVSECPSSDILMNYIEQLLP
ncbi:MAG: hypothetical protein K2O44_00815 [Clostridia bacterium]|nr:hypothetical protein [Clostridia bacterium]